MNESVVYVKHASIKSVKNLIVNTCCPRMLLHTTLIIDDVNILTVWHKLAYWPTGDRVFIILVSRWIADSQPVVQAQAQAERYRQMLEFSTKYLELRTKCAATERNGPAHKR